MEQFDDLEKVDFPAESLKYDRCVQLQRQQSMKMYSKEEIVEICKTMHHFAEYISSNIMQCFIRNEWTTEQEELLQQAPAEDDEYIAFINLGFQC